MIDALFDYFRATSLIELIAMALALAYLLFAIRASAWCWPLAFVSSALYVYVFAGAHLYMDAVLNIFFAAMAVYGWYQWRYGGPAHGALPISRTPSRVHLAALGTILLLTLVSGSVLGRYTNQAWPYIDSFIAWASVVTTWLAARKFLENWWYWIAIDTLAIPVYVNRHLSVTALLFAVYVVLAAVGLRSWSTACREQGRAA